MTTKPNVTVSRKELDSVADALYSARDAMQAFDEARAVVNQVAVAVWSPLTRRLNQEADVISRMLATPGSDL